MLQSDSKHQWWNTATSSWVTPGYYSVHTPGLLLGGSSQFYPSGNVDGDTRHYLSFWGSNNGLLGACCSSGIDEQGTGWSLSFTVKAYADCQEACLPTPTCPSYVLAYYSQHGQGTSFPSGSWQDLSGSSRDATPTGGVSVSSNYLTFDGTGYLDTTMTKGTIGSDYTIAAEVKFSGSTGQTYSAVVGSTDPTGGGTEFFFGKNSGDTCIGMQDGNYNGCLSPTSSLFDGGWHTVILSQRASVSNVFVDGVHVGGPTTYSHTNSQEKILIGMELEGAGYGWTGEMKQVIFLDHGVANSDVLGIHNAMELASGGAAPWCSSVAAPHKKDTDTKS